MADIISSPFLRNPAIKRKDTGDFYLPFPKKSPMTRPRILKETNSEDLEAEIESVLASRIIFTLVSSVFTFMSAVINWMWHRKSESEETPHPDDRNLTMKVTTFFPIVARHRGFPTMG